MIKRIRLLLLGVLGTVVVLGAASAAVAQQAGGGGGEAELGRIVLAMLDNGSSVVFTQARAGSWGIEVAGPSNARFSQQQPVQIELYRSDNDIQDLGGGYTSAERQGDGITAQARIDAGNGVSFAVTDQWSAKGGVLVLRRKLTVVGTLAGAGFYSAIRLHSDPDLTWPDVSFLAPSILYGDTTYNGRGPGGAAYDQARRYSLREDCLPAPFIGMLLRNGDSLTVLDEAPRGNTVTQEGTIDERFAFGGFGANETKDGGVEMGFWLPGTTATIGGGFGRGGVGRGGRGGAPGGGGAQGTAATSQAAQAGSVGGGGGAGGAATQPGGVGGVGFFGPDGGRGQAVARPQPGQPRPVVLTWNRRYNPVKDGFTQSYQIGFRFGTREAFADLIRSSYRWAWHVLKPAVNWQDMDVVRRSLVDQLSSQVYTFDGRTGLPFIVSTVTGKVFATNPDPNFYWRATMGFVGKNIEAADQLLRESDRDPSARGQKMRQQGLDVIATMIRMVPMVPPSATGFNLKTGAPDMTNKPQWFIREATDDMRMLMEAYDREKAAGREHPEWIGWCKEFADWCLTQQRPDGSFPRSYQMGTQEAVQDSGTTSYNVAPLFPMLSKDLGDPKYLASALRAAEYVWQNFGSRGIFIGGAIDNPNITDKEAGMLSLEAFMSLYEATHEVKWLHRAQIAADYAESWMWIWNLPMPEDGDDARLHWKKGVPTTGGQGITAQTAGTIDQFMDLSTASYAKLYRYTGDAHYKDVARILLHNTKAMTALPGRLYGMFGPGWQQEHWVLTGNRRGYGQPEKWMPWVTTNHLYSIYGLEAYDLQLYKELAEKPQ